MYSLKSSGFSSTALMSDVFRSASVQHLKKHGPAVFDYCYWLSDGVDS